MIPDELFDVNPWFIATDCPSAATASEDPIAPIPKALVHPPSENVGTGVMFPESAVELSPEIESAIDSPSDAAPTAVMTDSPDKRGVVVFDGAAVPV